MVLLKFNPGLVTSLIIQEKNYKFQIIFLLQNQFFHIFMWSYLIVQVKSGEHSKISERIFHQILPIENKKKLKMHGLPKKYGTPTATRCSYLPMNIWYILRPAPCGSQESRELSLGGFQCWMQMLEIYQLKRKFLW